MEAKIHILRERRESRREEEYNRNSILKARKTKKL